MSEVVDELLLLLLLKRGLWMVHCNADETVMKSEDALWRRRGVLLQI